MRVAVGSDDRCLLVDVVVARLEDAGYEVLEPVPVGDPWPDVGRAVAEAVASGEAELGVVACWTGTGVSIAANKVAGVRAALCVDAESARGARRWNDANVLALSQRLTTPSVGEEILDAFLGAAPDEDERSNFERLG
ncbi:MAG TPA: RpiB/LacA/LacB family sugar-phosphate isomerase [Acidimicrobiales bacterium]|jgi:ribose 5-phosphate isomerase B|nr:RpiB/LacA/LacB family sugar-phosphate isomerase [Acidimicrobiales bacterium]